MPTCKNAGACRYVRLLDIYAFNVCLCMFVSVFGVVVSECKIERSNADAEALCF